MEKTLYLLIFAIACFIFLAIILVILYGGLGGVSSSISNVVIR